MQMQKYSVVMCGRIVVDYDEMLPVAANSELADWMRDQPEGTASSWNVSPTEQIPVVFSDPKTAAPRFETAHWSLIPPWSKELKTKFPTFNARIETAAEKASFKSSVQAKRCVIPVSAFYEWSGPKGERTPHAIFGPTPMLPLAGLYAWWREPGAAEGKGWHLTATILTRASAGIMKPIHDRMPVFMSDELVHDWLNPEITGDQLLLDAASELAIPISKQLREHAVRPLRGNGPGLINPS